MNPNPNRQSPLRPRRQNRAQQQNQCGVRSHGQVDLRLLVCAV
jgi:hypothetical protein